MDLSLSKLKFVFLYNDVVMAFAEYVGIIGSQASNSVLC